MKTVREQDVEGLSLPGRLTKLLVGPETVGSEKLSFGVTIVPPRTAMEPHIHEEEEEAIFVLSGSGRALVGSEEQEVGPGVAIYIPKGIEHAMANDGEDEMRFTFAFSPAIKLG